MQSHQGNDAATNLITLCATCHHREQVQAQKFCSSSNKHQA